MSEIKVSAILLTYNQEKFVGNAIESLLEQDFDDYELLVCDDGSTDKTVRVIDDIVDHTGRDITIKRLYSETNRGIIDNVNKGLRAFRGKYFIIMGGDDIALPGRIKTVFELFERDPDCKLVLSSWYNTDSGGTIVSERVLSDSEYAYFGPSAPDSPKSMYASSPVCGASAAYSRDVWDVFGAIRTSGIYGEDNVLFVRSLLLGKIVNISRKLMLWRRHEESVSYVGKSSSGTPDISALSEGQCKILKNHEKLHLQWEKDIETSLPLGLHSREFCRELTHLAVCKCHAYRLQRHSLSRVRHRLWLRSVWFAVKSGCKFSIILKAVKLRFLHKHRTKFILKRT